MPSCTLLLTNDRDTFLVDNSTWQKMKIEIFSIDNDSMTCIIAALKNKTICELMKMKNYATFFKWNS